MESSMLLQAVAGMARAVRSLYGPNKFRKQVTDELDQTLFSADSYTVASVLKSQNAGTAMLQQALDQQHEAFGTGCTTMVTLCGVLAEAALELQCQGIPTDIIQQALTSVEKCCLSTAKHMRVYLTEVIPEYNNLKWVQKLLILGQLLASTPNSMSTSLAVEIASILDPIQFCDQNVSLKHLFTAHVVLGGVTSASSSQVYTGIILPIQDASRSYLRSQFSASDDWMEINGGVVIIAGDLEMMKLPTAFSIQIIFVYGEISTKLMDYSASTSNSPLYIPVSSYNTLTQLSRMTGAAILDSWEEILPTTIGHENLYLKSLELSVKNTRKDEEDDEFASFFVQISTPTSYQLHASVIIQGPTRSLAIELRNETQKLISRLRNVLRSNFVLPGNGALWCACAAAVTLEAESQAKMKLELLSFAILRLANQLTQLGIILLEICGGVLEVGPT